MNKDYIKMFWKASDETHIPWEFQRLRFQIENSKWHHFKTVYDHTNEALEVFDSWCGITHATYADEGICTKTDRQRTRTKDANLDTLIRAALLWHDVGKIKPKVSGETISYPRHEALSASLYYAHTIACHPNFLRDRPYENAKPRKDNKIFLHINHEFVFEFIRNHGKMHNIILQEDVEEKIDALIATTSLNAHQMKQGLLQIGLADTIASHLAQTRSQEYAQRLHRYSTLLTSVFQKKQDLPSLNIPLAYEKETWIEENVKKAEEREMFDDSDYH